MGMFMIARCTQPHGVHPQGPPPQAGAALAGSCKHAPDPVTWWDVEDTRPAQDSRELEPGPAMRLVRLRHMGNIRRTTIEQL